MNTATCPHCQKTSSEVDFFKNRGRKTGLSVLCKTCLKTYDGSHHRRAARTWNNIVSRLKRQPSYADCELRIGQADFVSWYVLEISSLPHMDQPSVDRIDSDGHYELGNIRIITRGENSRLMKRNKNVHAPADMAWCTSCSSYLDTSSFWKCKTRFNGLQTRCKSCQTAAINRSRGLPTSIGRAILEHTNHSHSA